MLSSISAIPMERINDLDQETKLNIVKISAGVIVLGTTGYILHSLYRIRSKASLIKKKREELLTKKNSLLKKLENLKTPLDNMETITNLKLKDLIIGISSGKYKPIDVLQAYQAKALIMDKELNFITDINPNVDEDLVNVDKVKKGVLWGIPVSIKESYLVKGCNCTWGMLDLTSTPSERDDVMVRTIRLQGMIPFVTTNMAQSGYSIECSNPIFGETLNPYNKSRTCGGSSGGEGAILGSGASILGLGGDIGGSIRIPSSYCGVYGLKPTSLRFSNRHCKWLYAKQNLINASIGPMARNLDDLVTFFKTLACGDLYHLDPYCPPLCFNDKIFEKKKPLKIGYYTHLGTNQVSPVPAVVRAVGMAKTALEKAGHTLVEFSIPDIDHAIFNLYFRCLFSDGGVGFVDYFLKDNPIDPSIAFTTRVLRTPNIFKQVLSYIIYPFNKNYSRLLYACCGVHSVHKLWQLKNDIDEYRELVLAKWQEEKLDGIICPVLPISAPPLRKSGYIMDIISYTSIYNLLDYPAGSTPVTRVNQNDIDQLIQSYPRNTMTHRQIVEYQKESIDMPIGVQTVSMLWREETCLRIMRDITDNIQ